MITDGPRPLPDCRLCGTPTRRRVHRANDGMCSDCKTAYDASRGTQQTLLLPLEDAPDTGPDLSNVVLLRPRPRPGGRR